MTDIKRFYTKGYCKKYEDNYGKIKWSDKVNIKEFAPKEKESEFEKFKRKLEDDNIIAIMSDEQEWVMEDTWNHQQKRIDGLVEMISNLHAIHEERIDELEKAIKSCPNWMNFCKKCDACAIDIYMRQALKKDKE